MPDIKVNCIVNCNIKLSEPTKEIFLSTPLAYNNTLAHAMRVTVYNDDGTEADLTGVGVTGVFLRADDNAVDPINGDIVESASGVKNIAEIILPASCYIVPGRFTFSMNLTAGNATRTALWVEGHVKRNTSGTIIDPGTPVGNIEQAIGNANSAASAANAAAETATQAAAAAQEVADNVEGEVSELKSALQYNVDDITRKMTYVRGDNLCRGDDSVKSGYMGTNGTVYPSSDYVYTEKIPVIEGDAIRGYNTQDGSFAQRALRFVTAFDSTGNAVAASGLNSGWSYTVPDGITHIVVSIAVGTNYMISTGTVKTQYEQFNGYWKATSDFIGDLLDRYVAVDGVKQVQSGNIADLEKTERFVQSTNLFPSAELVAHDQFLAGISPNTGKAYLTASQGYDTYIIPVDGNSVYSFTYCRTAVVVSDLSYTPVGDLLTYATKINTSGGAYVLFSFKPADYPTSDYAITRPIPVYQAINWEIVSGQQKNAIASADGSITDGDALTVNGRSALKDGQMITFVGKVDSFGDGFELDFWTTAAVTNSIVVDDTNIAVKYNTNAAVPVAHGLSISSANTIALTVQFVNGKAKIALYSNGQTYKAEYDWVQTLAANTQPRILSNSAVFDNASLTVTYGAASRDIWIFGDSYLSISTERWPYYLINDGYGGNALMNGAPGGTSAAAAGALETLLKYGTPKFAIMATGMNDGSDAQGEPPSLWTTWRDMFISKCEENSITPVLCTVPTVSSVNNEAKNAWVRSSGYRYIDFAKAVGADGTGAWYSGMLSSDNVHPTANGAKALYTQVLIDLPEITISN